MQNTKPARQPSADNRPPIKTYSENTILTRSREFIKHPGVFILDKSKSYGSSFFLKLPLRHVLCTLDPEVMTHVLVKNQKNYRKSFAYKQLRLALGMGLVTSEGDYWRKQRRMAQPAFYKTQLEELFRGMFEVTENYVADLAKKQGTVIDVSAEMMKITADVVLRTLFSADNTLDQKEMYRQMVGAQEYVVHRINYPFTRFMNYLNGRHRQFLKDRKAFDKTIFGIIRSRQDLAGAPNDLLTMLLSARDADTGEGMTETQLRDEAITIFAAGHETSANALTWTLMLLSKHPAVVQKMRQETDEILQGKTATFRDIPRLQYTKQVIEEGMRLYPPAHAVGREAIAEDEIKGTKIKKDMIVLLSIFSMHRSDLYYENPEKFDPDRFAPERAKARPKNAYLPFGAGPRMCIGNHFAMMEMQLILASLIQKFDFEYVAGQKIEMHPLITLKPKENILLKLMPKA